MTHELSAQARSPRSPRAQCERCGHKFDEGEHGDMGRPGSATFELDHYIENNIGYLREVIRSEVELGSLEAGEEELKEFLDRLEREAILPEEKLRPRRVCKACSTSKGFHEEERCWLELQEAKSVYNWLKGECRKGNIVDAQFLESYRSGEVEVLEGVFRKPGAGQKRAKERGR